MAGRFQPDQLGPGQSLPLFHPGLLRVPRRTPLSNDKGLAVAESNNTRPPQPGTPHPVPECHRPVLRIKQNNTSNNLGAGIRKQINKKQHTTEGCPQQVTAAALSVQGHNWDPHPRGKGTCVTQGGDGGEEDSGKTSWKRESQPGLGGMSRSFVSGEGTERAWLVWGTIRAIGRRVGSLCWKVGRGSLGTAVGPRACPQPLARKLEGGAPAGQGKPLLHRFQPGLH